MRRHHTNLTTDIHADPFYEAYSSTENEKACHRGQGPAGKFGAETSDCDSPLALVNATFHWIDKHLKDSIDFIVWTGDSARHDNDEDIPRTEKQVVELNKLMVAKFVEVFGKEDNDDDPTNDFTIPIVPNFGNNDILPHNIFNPGPNRWTRKYLEIWRKLIPEDQRHVFGRGGYFFVEVIPNKLAIFSLNTLYFFDSNTAVDGCAKKSEPGYEQMQWLRNQLQLVRRRGMKAILTGHVPPARTENKMSWDETCWHKYTLWMRQYRDVIVGSLYGHMNIDHFMLQDWHKVDDGVMNGETETLGMTALDDEFSIQSSADYLSDLQQGWRKLPNSEGVTVGFNAKSEEGGELQGWKNKKKKKKPKKSKEEKFFGKIGGEWGERYSLTLVAGSVVPNYFPSLRVFEYNTTGIEDLGTAAAGISDGRSELDSKDIDRFQDEHSTDADANKKESKELKKSKRPKFTTPLPPSEAAPPGPAYSPQTLTWLGYTQYFANLTTINNDFHSDFTAPPANAPNREDSTVEVARWHEGKHSGKRPQPKKVHRKFQYEVEYDTRSDSVYNLTDLTVRNYIGLASRMGRYKPPKHGYRFKAGPVELGSKPDDADEEPIREEKGDGLAAEKKKKKHDKKKSKKERKRAKRQAIEKLWFTFVRRAYIGSKDEDDLKEEFGHR